MDANFSKLTWYLLATSASVFAQDLPSCAQGEVLNCSCQYSGSYNAPASIDLNGSVHFFVDASFIYWYAKEDGLEIANSAVVGDNGVSYLSINGEMFTQPAEYQPGFKVGLGFVGAHEWVLAGEYTWYRTTTTSTKSAPENNTAFAGMGVWSLNDWFLQTTLGPNQALSAITISSKWHLSMDSADLLLSRPFYSGKRMILTPFGGLRALWIRQQMNVDATLAAASEGGFVNLTKQPVTSTTSSHNWGVGPKIGMEGSLLFGMGFRLEGSFAANLLYTQFTSVNHYEEKQSLRVFDSPIKLHLNDYSCVRPIAEVGLGAGWGVYFFDRKGHFDFFASYDFSYFWGQNEMRSMLDQSSTGTGSQAGDLYFQGLTLTARFDF